MLIISPRFLSSYHHLAPIFTWLILALFAYIAAAFLVRPDWYSVLSPTFMPRIKWFWRRLLPASLTSTPEVLIFSLIIGDLVVVNLRPTRALTADKTKLITFPVPPEPR